MSSKKLDISEINFDTSTVPGRILWLADYMQRHEKMGIGSNKAFLDIAGLNSSYISDIKNGKIKKPTADVVGSIVKTYDVNPYWLLDGIGEPFKNYLDESVDQLIESTPSEVGKSISLDQFLLFLLNQVEKFAKNLKVFLGRSGSDD